MVSRVQQKLQFARNRGFKVGYVQLSKRGIVNSDGWYIFSEADLIALGSYHPWGPYQSKRAAKNAAYRLAVGQAV
jgi:hypothetical protein